MADVQVIKDGPYALDADGLKLLDLSGKPLDVPEGEKIFLCRCGRSDNKPFCDGQHRKTGFKHDPSA